MPKVIKPQTNRQTYISKTLGFGAADKSQTFSDQIIIQLLQFCSENDLLRLQNLTVKVLKKLKKIELKDPEVT